MGFYHDTTVLFGSRVEVDDPHKLYWQVIDALPEAERILGQQGVQASLIGSVDREEVYLYTDHQSLDIGKSFSTAEYKGKDDIVNLWAERIQQASRELGITLAMEPGWVTIHEYR